MFQYYLLIVLSTFLFLHGFFPLVNNENKSRNSNHSENFSMSSIDGEIVHTTNTKKLVLIIIDALRTDFVSEELMPVLHKYANKQGCLNNVTVETPTVTMPRIKALTTGNVPQFVDLIMNLASTEILEDSFLHSAKQKNKNIVFYGDDTWIKLFPNFFHRSEGTTSFFVNDFTEVDQNVTRNVHLELEKNDWDIMILHYLGLDHIGHVLGPKSSLVLPKLQEMDGIIQRIYTELSNRTDEFIIIVTGDHGMRDSGGHGGSTFAETNVPLAILGISCSHTKLAQTDVPANIAVILGIDIPSTSIGQIYKSLLSSFSFEKYLHALRCNTLLLNAKKSCGDYVELATKFHNLYLKNLDAENAKRAIEFYEVCSKLISEHLMKSSVNQNTDSLIISIMTMIYLITVFLKIYFVDLCTSLLSNVEIITLSGILISQFYWSNNNTMPFSVIFISTTSLKNIFQVLIDAKFPLKFQNIVLHFTLVVTILQPFTFFSSSFVEEEHLYWYFSIHTFCFISLIITLNKNKLDSLQWVAFMLLFRFIRSINQTGDKWASRPDVSDWLLQNEHFLYLQIIFFLGLLGILIYSVKFEKEEGINLTVLSVVTLLLIFAFKNFDFKNVILGRIIWVLIFIYTVMSTVLGKGCIISWLFISSLLLKSYNVILVPSCIFASTIIHNHTNDIHILTLTHVWLSNFLYFAQGHSNSLASVDVSVGYIGLESYQPLLVIAQVLCHTYAFPVLSHLLLLRENQCKTDSFWKILFTVKLITITLSCIVTLIHKDHLFIWSVFAPKLFIESSHVTFLFIEFVIYSVVHYVLYDKFPIGKKTVKYIINSFL